MPLILVIRIISFIIIYYYFIYYLFIYYPLLYFTKWSTFYKIYSKNSSEWKMTLVLVKFYDNWLTILTKIGNNIHQG